MQALAAVQASQTPGLRAGSREPLAQVKAPVAGGGGSQDRVELSAQAQEAKKALPAFGRFDLGGAEPLPFGPDLNASILNRIPGDGFREPQHGVELGHQPVRGLNILA